jgi:hypothetical protein
MKKELPIIKNSKSVYAINNIFYACNNIRYCSNCIFFNNRYPSECKYYNILLIQQELRKKLLEKKLLELMFSLLKEKQ